MPDDPQHPDRVRFSLKKLFVAMAMVGLLFGLCAAEWRASGRKVFRERREFAERMTDYGGEVIYGTDEETTAKISWPRRRLGDRAAVEVRVPYGFPGDYRSPSQAMFPEAHTISVASPEPLLEKVFGGADALDIVRNPDRVEACGLVVPKVEDRPEINRRPQVGSDLSPFPPNGDWVEVSNEAAGQLADALLAGDSYQWWVTRMTSVLYSERLAFIRGDERVDVLFDFRADLIFVFRNGRAVGEGNLNGSRKFFVNMMKELFPADATIQARPSRVR